MTSVGILTVHQSVNCGASLQAAALYKSIIDCGADPTIVNYCPQYFVSYMDECNAEIHRSPRGRIKNFLIGQRLKKTMECFNSYGRKNYPCITERFNSLQDIENSGIEYDVFLCGSDQIWNPDHVKYDRVWLLDFANAKKAVNASYAASLGKDVLGENGLEWLCSGIAQFDCISVREKNSVEVLEQAGVHSVQCLDPTLLRSKEEWRLHQTAPDQKLPDRYIFYYPIEENALESEMLAALKRKTGLPCVALTDSFRRPKHADIQITGFGPEQFLYLINHAEIVFTNSFHGLVFSLLFEKLLVSYKNETKNSRLESMFHLLGLSDYQVNSAADIDEMDFVSERERFISSYANLEKEIQFSREYLRAVIQAKKRKKTICNNIDEVVCDKKCTGCGSCESSCPTGCISMKTDSEGFVAPCVNKEKCIDCGKCKKVCHAVKPLHRSDLGNYKGVLFASDDAAFYQAGTSGGAFGILAKKALLRGYKVYGATFINNYIVKHVAVDTDSAIRSLQGSKYVQSDIQGLFEQINRELLNEEHILFSGTPCQIAALKCYLDRDDPNLITLDIVCHGVPSPRFWKKDIEKQTNGKEMQVSFRSKIGFDRYGYALVLSEGSSKSIIPWQEDVYYRLFMENLSLRECCYRCRYASSKRLADITLGDCACLEKYRELDNIGIGTAVYANTDIGLSLVNEILDEGFCEKLDIGNEIARNRQLSTPAKRPQARDRVYRDLRWMSFDQFEMKYLGAKSIIGRIKSSLKKYISWKTKLRMRRCRNKLISQRD